MKISDLPFSLTLQTFDDTQKDLALAKIFPFDLQIAAQLNTETTAGIFWCINPQENKNARGIENTSQLSCIGLDLDAAKQEERRNDSALSELKAALLEKIKILPLTSSGIIETKHGFQPWWLFTDPVELKNAAARREWNTRYRGLIEGFAQTTGLKSEGDNIARVLRFPGFFHQKGKPFRIKEIYPEGRPTTLKEFSQIYGVIRPSRSSFNPEILLGVPDGQRGISATSLVGKLLHHFPVAEWESVVWPLMERWNERNSPPLEHRVLRKTFESIAESEASKREQRRESLANGTDLSSVRFSLVPKPLSELNAEIGDVDWIWEGFLAKGHITLLSAFWKSGKTTLVAQLLKCIAAQKPLAGKEVKQSKVLILSEESEALWARRREEFSLSGNVWIISRPVKQKLNDGEWVALLKEIADLCRQKEVDLFILDTLSGFWAVDNENDAARIMSALLPLNHLLGQNVSVLLVHHFRKSGGTEGTASRGSGALGSYVDILVEFSRMNSDDPNSTQRVLRTYSRFEESPKEVVIELIDDEYVTLGTKAEVSKTAKLQKVLFLLPDASDGVTITELLDSWVEDSGPKPHIRTLRRYLKELVNQRKAKVIGEKMVGKSLTPLYARSNKNDGQDSVAIPSFEADNAGQDRPPSDGDATGGDELPRHLRYYTHPDVIEKFEKEEPA